jgi:hypothetical protein
MMHPSSVSKIEKSKKPALVSSSAESSTLEMKATYFSEKFLDFKGVFSVILEDKKNSVACVREQTIPTERPPLVGEVSSDFCA